MPVVKLAATKDGRKLANYLQRDASGNDRAVFVSESRAGEIERVNSAQHAEKDFQSVREHYCKTDGVQAHMAYISFKRDDLGDLAKPDGKPDWEKIEAFSHEYAQRAGIAEKHQYYVVAHEDKANPHVHLVWNAVSEVNGSKYHSAKNENVERMRDVADALSREHGIKHLPEREKNNEKVHDKVIRAVGNGAPRYSWKRDLQKRIKGEAIYATSWDDYKKKLAEKGVEIRERGKGVSYSFTDSAGHKHVARGSRLGGAYTREDIERRFEHHRRLDTMTGRQGFEYRAKERGFEEEHFRSWQQELRAAFREAERKAHSPEEFHRLAQERGLSVTKGQEGRYELHYRDRFGAEHTAGAEVMKRGTTDQALTARIEATRENPIQERQESAAPGRITGAAARGAEGVSRAITREVEKASTPHGATPDHGHDRERERKRTTGNEDGMRSHDGLDRGGW